MISSAASSYRNANALRSSNSEILSGIVSKLDRTEQTQAGIMKKMETVDSATTICLSDSREHVDKKFERNERSMDVAFDEVWEKVGLNNLEMKQVRDILSGHDPRRTPQNDDAGHDIGPKRRRYEE